MIFICLDNAICFAYNENIKNERQIMSAERAIFTENWKKKNHNLFALLRMIWEQPGITRHEMSRQSGCNKVVITKRIKNLMDMGIIEEGESSVSKRGRRPISLRFKAGALCTAGLSLHWRTLTVSLFDPGCGGIIAREEYPTEGLKWQEICDLAIEKLENLLNAKGIAKEKLAGTGMSFTGIFNPVSGLVVASAEFPEQCGFNVKEYIVRKSGIKIDLINIGHLHAHMERRMGKARNMKSFLYVHAGFGLGMVLNGMLYRGHQFQAGEISYVQLNETGPKGMDGREGLFIDVAPFYRLTDQIEELIKNNGSTLVRNYIIPGTTRATLEMVAKAIKDKDMLCAELMSQNFRLVGRMVLNLAYIFNPEAIFFEPWTEDCQESSIEVMKRMMGHYGVRHWGLKTEILSAATGDEQLPEGTSMLPLDVLFEVPGFV